MKQEKKEAKKFLNSCSTPIVEAPSSIKKNDDLLQMVIKNIFIFKVTI